MNARQLSNRLVDLLRREHHALAEFLVALAAFDCERRWAELGHASLFSFLRRDLGLSAGAAQYRKTAAELVQKYPAVEAALRDGRLCLSSVIELAKVMTPENSAELLPRFFGLSSRDAAFLAASIRPVENPPRRDFIVTQVRHIAAVAVAASDGPKAAVDGAASLELRAPEMAHPLDSASAVPAEPTRQAVPDRPTIKPLDAERARVNMTVTRRLLDKLAAARDALSHSHPGASEEEILEVGLDLILERQAKRRGIVKNPRKVPAPQPAADTAPQALAAPPDSYIPAHIRREVWKRDGGRCQFPLDGSGVCGSTYQVELDHIIPVAKGGPSTAKNIRCACKPHNLHAAREALGDTVMDRYSRNKRTNASPGTSPGSALSQPAAL
jgi:hypothetical protein